MPLNPSITGTKSSVLLLDTCTHLTNLHIWMACGARLTYPSVQSLHQRSTRFQGTATSWIAQHRAGADPEVRHFCMVCTIAFICICVLGNILSSCAFISPHHRILKIKFTGCVHIHYSHLTVPQATPMCLLGKNACTRGSVQLINE